MIQPHHVISPAYKALQVELHARPKGYGGKGDKWASAVRALMTRYSATSVLDYGCGEGALKAALKPMCDSTIRIDEYDPAIPGKNHWPEFADLVVCTDVLEHVEPDRLATVLAHLRLLARKAVFAVIATRPSNKIMADGRNAHLIQESDDWWVLTLVAAGFAVQPNPPISPLKKPSRECVVVLT